MSTGPDLIAARRAELERRLATLSPEQRARLAEATAVPAGATQTIRPREPGTPVPLSFAQELLWRLEWASPGYAYNVPRAVRLRGTPDEAALQQALDALVARHEVLRTTFEVVDGEPRQMVHPTGLVPIARIDLTDRPLEEREAAARARMREIARQPFDLATDRQLRATLVRLAEQDYVLLLLSHHIVTDEWSANTLVRELTALYDGFRTGRPAELPPLPVQYGDYSVWQRRVLAGERLDELLGYWSAQLAGAPAQIDLPIDHSRPATPSFEGAFRTAIVPPPVLEQLRTLARSEAVTPFMVLLAALYAVLQRYTGETELVVGTPVAGRPYPELEPVVGYFVNMLLLRTSLAGEPTFRKLLERVRGTTLGGYDHQEMPLETLVTARGDGDGPIATIPQVVLTTEDPEREQLELAGTSSSAFGVGIGATKFDLTMWAGERADGLHLAIEFRTDLFDAATIDRLLRHYSQLLGGAVAAPDTPVRDIPIQAPEERLVIEEWNRTATDYPREAYVHELFAALAARRPEAVAVAQDGVQLTYAELDERSSALAQRLAALGVEPGELVGLCAERSFGQLVGMLGILKAGAAYVPLDPDYPAERLGFMLQDTRMRVVLAQPEVRNAVEDARRAGSSAAPAILLLDHDGRLTGDAPLMVPQRTGDTALKGDDSARRPAYVMYTSGSTGRPKGVLVPHRAIVRLVRDTNYVSLTEDDAILGFAPSSFDAATFEIWGALLNGGRVVLAPPGLLDPGALGELVEREGVTTAWLTAGLFQQVVEAGLDQYRTVRQLLVGGDVLPVPQVRRALAALPRTQLINGYGPTENTTFTTCFPIPAHWPADRAIPIGRPIANTRVYVLDAWGQPVPVGVPGELYAAGDGVALGYLDRPELTAERFLPDPFAATPGARMYRTGDKVRWRSDGVIEFLGRMDQQVKVRGFRVEPEEVEAAIRSHPGVKDAAVIARRSEHAGVQLVGYYVPQRTEGNGIESVTVATLRAYLAERLPDYYLPAFLVPLEALPIGPTGKLNRKELPAPESGTATAPIQAPRTTIEHELLQIWERLLQPGRRIGVFEDFFEIGGHSLLAIQMIAEVQRVRGQRVPLAWLFEASTIASLAARLAARQFAEPEPPLVVLQGDTTGPPIAFVHGDWTGGGWYVRRLAPLAAPNSPFYVLPTVGEDEEEKAWTIEAIAARHLAELRNVQPHGPYRLAGLCISGVIAYEMGCQLVAAGERIDKLIVIDGGLANGYLRFSRPLIRWIPGDPRQQLARRVAVLGWLRWIDFQVRKFRSQSLLAGMGWAARATARRVPVVRDLFRLDPPDADELVAGARDGLDEQAIIGRVQQRAAEAYVPKSYPGTIDFLFAAGVPGGYPRPNPVDRWRLAAREVRLRAIPSGHIGLVTENLPLFAEALRETLERPA